MAISTQDYVKKPNENIEQYNTRIASLRGDTPAELATMNTLSANSVNNNPAFNAGIINAPTPQSVTNSIANILSSSSGTPGYVESLQKQQADLLKMYQDQSQSIMSQMQGSATGTPVNLSEELRKLQEQYGIPEYLGQISALAPEISAIQEKINAIDQREAQAIENVRNKPVSEFTAQGQEAALKRQAAIERSGYAAELGVKQAMVESLKGNVTQARSLISDAVQAYTFDIQQKNDDMDRMYKFYGDFIGQLDKNTQNQLNIVRDELSAERERQIKDANTIGDMMLKYPNSGIKFSDTVQQATVKAQSEAAANKKVTGTTTSEYKQTLFNQALTSLVQKATEFGGKLTPDQYRAMENKLISDGLGSYIDEFKTKASPYLSYEDKGKVGIQTEKQFLNTDYFKTLFTPEQLSEEAMKLGKDYIITGGGFWTKNKGDTEKYLNYLMSLVEQYRKANYSDTEILKLMK